MDVHKSRITVYNPLNTDQFLGGVHFYLIDSKGFFTEIWGSSPFYYEKWGAVEDYDVVNGWWYVKTIPLISVGQTDN